MRPHKISWCSLKPNHKKTLTVFIADVSRVYANYLSRKVGKKQNQTVHTHCISETLL